MTPQALPLIRLLHLASPALPIGSFAFSQGLEWMIDCGALRDEDRLRDWWQGLLLEGLARSDLAVLWRLQAAWSRGDDERVRHWNDELLASRETHELFEEDRHVGRALVKLLVSLEIDGAAAWRQRDTALATAWALASVRWGIPADSSLLGYAWAWLENQIVVAGKVLPLGQTPAQRLLLALTPTLVAACEKARTVPDEDIGAALPGWVMASALHETQYSRLFRS